MAVPIRAAPRGAAILKTLPKSKRQYVGAAMPEFIEPQLATLVSEPPPASNWVHEIKFDGYRMQGRIEKGRCVLRSRKGLDWTSRFPEIAKAYEGLPDSIIDGEICAVDEEGLPSFSGLQSALSSKKTSGLVFFVFDLLWLGREDYRPWALGTRKAVLEKHLKVIKSARVRYVDHHEGQAAALFKSSCQMKLEGIVSKLVDASYRSGRMGLWTKTKCRPRQELVIGGWDTNNGHFSSLLLGLYRDGKFSYAGTAGTGFNSRNLPPIMAKLRQLETNLSPFQVNSPKKKSSIHFVAPKLVCEVAFETWTRSGKIRQASFKGMREDKNANEIVMEEVPNDD